MLYRGDGNVYKIRNVTKQSSAERTTSDVGCPLSTLPTLGMCSERPHSNNETPVLQGLIRMSTQAEAARLSDIRGGQHQQVNSQHLDQFETDTETESIDSLRLHGTTTALFKFFSRGPIMRTGWKPTSLIMVER